MILIFYLFLRIHAKLHHKDSYPYDIEDIRNYQKQTWEF